MNLNNQKGDRLCVEVSLRTENDEGGDLYVKVTEYEDRGAGSGFSHWYYAFASLFRKVEDRMPGGCLSLYPMLCRELLDGVLEPKDPRNHDCKLFEAHKLIDEWLEEDRKQWTNNLNGQEPNS